MERENKKSEESYVSLQIELIICSTNKGTVLLQPKKLGILLPTAFSNSVNINSPDLVKKKSTPT